MTSTSSYPRVEADAPALLLLPHVAPFQDALASPSRTSAMKERGRARILVSEPSLTRRLHPDTAINQLSQGVSRELIKDEDGTYWVRGVAHTSSNNNSAESDEGALWWFDSDEVGARRALCALRCADADSLWPVEGATTVCVEYVVVDSHPEPYLKVYFKDTWLFAGDPHSMCVIYRNLLGLNDLRAPMPPLSREAAHQEYLDFMAYKTGMGELAHLHNLEFLRLVRFEK